jgi:AraC family transcriptional activator of pobA
VKRTPVFAFRPPAPLPLQVEVQRLERRKESLQVGAHAHQFFELILLEQGGGVHRLAEGVAPVRAGDLYLIPPGVPHDPSGFSKARGFVVLFTADAVNPEHSGSERFALPEEPMLAAFLAPGILARPLRVASEAREAWRARMFALESELAEARPGQIEAARCHLRLLMIEAGRLAEAQAGGQIVAHRPLLIQVFAFINRRYRQPISLQDVAKAVGRSPAHLTDLVRRQTGRTVQAWILERRLAEARRLLLETDDDVGAIGEAVSYLDSGYFIRQFRKAMGHTPLQWRKAQRT